MTSSQDCWDGGSSPSASRFHQSRQDYADYLPLTQRIQVDLQYDAEQLRAQEGWDDQTWLGVEEWMQDEGSVFRALRRHRYDEERTLASLLTSLQQRIIQSLHQAIPSFPPYTSAALFHILPLPDHTDRLARPIAVLSVREVIRDEDGSLEDMKEWAWWALEMVRRTLRDYWVKRVWSRRVGEGGEGLVLIVDAAGAGYRNMEVELLPTLLSVGHDNFPGMIDAVFVVNAGWTHRSMWGIVKRVLPRSALDKVAFLDSQRSIEAVFELDKLPKVLGGMHPYTFSPLINPIYTYYTHHTSFDHPASLSRGPSRSSSSTSMADIFYSAPGTPGLSSRRASIATNLSGLAWRLGPKLRMTKSRDEFSSSQAYDHASSPPDSAAHPSGSCDVESPAVVAARDGQSKKPPYPTSAAQPVGSLAPTTLQRIKSLSDFHLYLSPSRLAHIDVLSDSDPEDERLRSPPARRTLRPAILDQGRPLSERRSRPPLRLLGSAGVHDDPNVRCYSDRLQLHHAKGLQKYSSSPIPSSRLADEQLERGGKENRGAVAPGPTKPTVVRADGGKGVGKAKEIDNASAAAMPSDSGFAPTLMKEPVTNRASPYDTSNPWFGYPVVRVPDPTGKGGTALRPRYRRNRKRDLVKTLLFLFMLRLQSWRDSLERILGLQVLFGSWSSAGGLGRSSTNAQGSSAAGGPTEGLLRAALGDRKVMMTKKWDRDWWWMIIGVLVLRSTWTRAIVAPLEALGWGREAFGLAM
ncbi:hypothetical protein IAU60_000264 [Kwoniella sp. DSM 27419]